MVGWVDGCVISILINGLLFILVVRVGGVRIQLVEAAADECSQTCSCPMSR